MGSFCTFAPGPPPLWPRATGPRRQIGFVWHGWPPAPAGQIGFVLQNRLPGSRPGLPKLGLFCRGLSNVLFTITPFPQRTYPFCRSAGNWLCLYNIPRPTPPGPAGQIGFVLHDLPSRERRSPDRHSGRNWVCLYSVGRPPRANWVRFASFAHR